jgi:pimeloyl-ACP methyl ester carboxylesterase
MTKLNFGTFQLYYEETGRAGEPVVLVHGYWGDHHQWDATAAGLAGSFRVLSYDRRGHGASSSPGGSVALDNQVGDLSTLLSIAGLGARHLVGTGVGGLIALQLALLHPEQVLSLDVHEPSLLGLLSDDPPAAEIYGSTRDWERSILQRLEARDPKGAAELYADGVSAQPGGWGELPPGVQGAFVANAPASFRELQDPTLQHLDMELFTGYREPVVVTGGDRSAPVFAAVNAHVVEGFYRALRHTYEGAGHFPHVTQPDQTGRVIAEFCKYAAARRS